jgi:hypothetical protein
VRTWSISRISNGRACPARFVRLPVALTRGGKLDYRASVARWKAAPDLNTMLEVLYVTGVVLAGSLMGTGEVGRLGTYGPDRIDKACSSPHSIRPC